MSDFAEWRPCRVCGLPVALPKRVHDECASKMPPLEETEPPPIIEALKDLHVQAIRLSGEYGADGRLAQLDDLARIWQAIDQLALIITKHMTTPITGSHLPRKRTESQI